MEDDSEIGLQKGKGKKRSKMHLGEDDDYEEHKRGGGQQKDVPMSIGETYAQMMAVHSAQVDGDDLESMDDSVPEEKKQSEKKRKTPERSLVGKRKRRHTLGLSLSVPEKTGSFSGIARPYFDGFELDEQSLTEEEKRTFDAIAREENVIVMGCFGAGKDRFMRKIASQLRAQGKNIAFTSATIGSSYAEGAEFIEDFIGLGPFAAPYSPEEFIGPLRENEQEAIKLKEKLKATQVLIIGNVFRLTGKGLDIINKTLTYAKHISYPFGGVQLILYGDLYGPNTWTQEDLCFQHLSWKLIPETHGLTAPCRIYRHMIIQSTGRHLTNYINQLKDIRSGNSPALYHEFKKCQERSPFPHLLLNDRQENIYSYWLSRGKLGRSDDPQYQKDLGIAMERLKVLNIDLDLPIWHLDTRIPPWTPTQICTSHSLVDVINTRAIETLDSLLMKVGDSKREWLAATDKDKKLMTTLDPRKNIVPFFYDALPKRLPKKKTMLPMNSKSASRKLYL